MGEEIWENGRIFSIKKGVLSFLSSIRRTWVSALKGDLSSNAWPVKNTPVFLPEQVEKGSISSASTEDMPADAISKGLSSSNWSWKEQIDTGSPSKHRHSRTRGLVWGLFGASANDRYDLGLGAADIRQDRSLCQQKFKKSILLCSYFCFQHTTKSLKHINVKLHRWTENQQSTYQKEGRLNWLIDQENKEEIAHNLNAVGQNSSNG